MHVVFLFVHVPASSLARARHRALYMRARRRCTGMIHEMDERIENVQERLRLEVSVASSAQDDDDLGANASAPHFLVLVRVPCCTFAAEENMLLQKRHMDMSVVATMKLHDMTSG